MLAALFASAAAAIPNPFKPQPLRAWLNVNIALINRQRVDRHRVNPPEPQQRRKFELDIRASPSQGSERPATMSTGSLASRRPCDAFRRWRMRTAGTGRLN